ncbi:DUF418 domain-containing protein [Actinotalea ferrariae]|uniref:DUF418 domain-containing protein n=1 Tax=Actinotalea ferrariae TaxID=1386098 RepID=UPI001C8B6339|nr:DUF418 domain-containing protein [Actinotalea ferrariae]MBX9245355.1 DUF418 domain-containing protein [Actinotalea ferrariae]
MTSTPPSPYAQPPQYAPTSQYAPPPQYAQPTTPPVPPPVSRAERSLAPDIGRGAMLLLIAIANVGLHRYGYPVDENLGETGMSTVDRAALFVESWFVADRARPMFAILYGFGIAMMAWRMAGRGVDQAGIRRALRRRSGWLIAFGVVHAVLLFLGDILAAYGATGLIALVLVNKSDRSLRRWFWVSLVIWEVLALVLVLSPIADLFTAGEAGVNTAPGTTYLEQLALGAGAAVISVLASFVLGFIAPVVVGFWLHRRGWLQHPEQHVAGLRKVLLVAVVVNVVANLPFALQMAQVIELDGALGAAAWTLHSTSGLLMGAGYICGFALLAVRWRERGRTGVPRLLAAVGERSLTAYLAQSLIMAPVLSMWGLGLGDDLGTAASYAFAIGTWLVILVAMVLLDRAGRRGPFETLLRRLTYGRTRHP